MKPQTLEQSCNKYLYSKKILNSFDLSFKNYLGNDTLKSALNLVNKSVMVANWRKDISASLTSGAIMGLLKRGFTIIKYFLCFFYILVF